MIRLNRRAKGSGLLLPTYVGPVCTRCRVNQNLASNTVAYGFTKRTYHYARDNITWLRLGYPNWYAQYAGGDGNAGSGNVLAASIEYPFTTATTGTTCHVATWGGAATGSTGAGTAWSDWMYCPIPAGAKFGSRLYLGITAGITSTYNDPTLYGGAWRDTAGGDVMDFTGSNLVAGGSMTDDGSQLDMTPIIVGLTRRPTIAIMGDSRQSGWKDTVDANIGDAGDTARTYGKYFAYLNLAIGGDTVASFVSGSNSASRRALSAYCSHVVTNMAINDVAAGTALATIEANITAMLGLPGIVGKPVLYDLVYPESASTDAWATIANQTVSTYNGVRNSLNAALQAGGYASAGIGADARTALEYPPIPSGLWNVPGLSADGTHPNQAGYQAIMNGGCVDPARIQFRA